MGKQIITVLWLILVIFPSISQSGTSKDSEQPPRLWVLVPGINTGGESMLNNAEQMLRYDPECTVIIQESNGWRDDIIKFKVSEATKKAIEKGKDVIVLVDMDLTHSVIRQHMVSEFASRYLGKGSRWFDAVDWAGQTMNLVAESYSKAGGKGQSIADCHSAGCDGFESSLRFAPVSEGRKVKLFDEVFLSNGRTNALELGPLLQENGYTPEQVRLLLNRGDLPALPQIFNLISGSISNLDAAKKHAGQWWTVFYAKEMSGRHMDHGVLVDKLRVPGTFEVYTGESSYSITATVEELKLGKEKTKQIGIRTHRKEEYKKDDKYPFKPPDPPDKFGGAGVSSIGGIIFDKDNAYTVDHTGRVARLARSALQARPNKGSTSWEFKQGGKSYKAVTVPLTKKKQESISRGDLYYDDKEKIVVFTQGHNIIALKCVQRGSNLHIIQIAKGKRIDGSFVSNKDISFIVDRVILTDYGLK